MIRVDVRFRRGAFSLNVAYTADAHVTGVFGPSGAGKSTLIHLIAGLSRPDRGVITVNGETLFDDAKRIDIPAHHRRIGVVFQEHRLFPHLSVKGNLLYGRPKHRTGGRGRGRGDGEFRRIVELLELDGLLRRRVMEISGGERQRIALGRALISEPRLLLLDEPLTSLDQRLKQQIIPYLQRVRDVLGVPMLHVSHDLTELLQLTDQLLILSRGEMVGSGRYGDLVHDERVVEVVHDRGMRTMLPARVVRHVPDEGTTMLQLGDEDDPSRHLVVPRCASAVGESVMVSVQPWDIALATRPMEQVSIQNQIRGTVTRCTLHERRAIVEVDIGAPLIVEVSRRSAKSLELIRGRPIICLIKSHALRTVEAG